MTMEMIRRFFAARRDGGLLTWGICRKDVRSKIRRGSICVFFAFTNHDGKIIYRMSAVTTVAEKIDRRSFFQDSRFQGKTYINLLIRPEGSGWRYGETDRHTSQRHANWLWRISEHGAMGNEEFRQKYAEIYNAGRFSDSDVSIDKDYILFSQEPDETYISQCPPLVAIARNGEHEEWINEKLQRLTIDTAAALHLNRRFFCAVGGSAMFIGNSPFNCRSTKQSVGDNR